MLPLHKDQISTTGFLKHINCVYDQNLDIDLKSLVRDTNKSIYYF